MTNSASRDLAIKYALENKWKEAYDENKKLLEESPDDIDTLNRIAYSAIKLGKFDKAKEFYKQVLKKDKTNPIALKNTRRLETISKDGSNHIPQPSPSMNLQGVFIEEAGTTETIELKNVADRKTLSQIQPGDIVLLSAKQKKIFVQMFDKTYLGVLPDNIGMRMITFMNGGNEYSACIKAVGDNEVTVFVKETKRMKKFKNQPTFVHSSISVTPSFADK